jgi:aspartate/methionine/tyrosine aminotransferase
MAVAISGRGAVEPEANRLKAAGHPVVSLAVGQPSDPAPQIVRDAAAAALAHGRIGYTDSLGLPALRQAIARHYGEHYGVEVDPARIAVTTGSSAGFNLAFLAMFDAGDRVAITVPGYPAYRNILAALGLDVVEIGLEGEGYLTARMLEAAHRRQKLKGVLFASPANPTGAIIPDAELARLVEAARAMGIAVISDEIYHRLAYRGTDTTALSFGDDVTIINSFSKYYCMTGWRIGWMVLPEALVRPVERITQSLYISAPELSQVGAIRAFEADEVLERVKERYRVNRAMLEQALPRLGLPLAAQMDGGFYAYCDVSRHTNDSMDFARRLLAERHVAATPGLDFDMVNGHRFLRLSYAGSESDVATAIERLEDWL